MSLVLYRSTPRSPVPSRGGRGEREKYAQRISPRDRRETTESSVANVAAFVNRRRNGRRRRRQKVTAASDDVSDAQQTTTTTSFADSMNVASSRGDAVVTIASTSGNSRSSLTYAPEAEEDDGDVAAFPERIYREALGTTTNGNINDENEDILRLCEPVSKFSDDSDKNNSEGSNTSTSKRKKLRIAVLLSGGVDSSVALSLLRAAGHECVAFYLQIWFQDDFRNFWDQCPWEEDLMVAKRVCERLRVPLRTVHFTDDYWNLVVKQSVDEIQRGKTPNPDILCNSRVKFGAFREWLDANEKEVGKFDRIASGHYAALEREEDDETNVKLVASGDARKDQTYFLAHLSSWQLEKAMFPIGGLPKSRIREIAENLSLVNADRKDSQGICFLGKVKFSEFIEEHLGTNPGEIREIESGEVLGTHKGFWFHTVGQRQGLKLDKRAHEGPWYVHSKDVEKNIVFISRSYHSEENERDRDSFECDDLSWCRDSDTDQIARIERCKVRHGESYYRVLSVESTSPSNNNDCDRQQKLKIKIDGKDQGLAKGQYAVFYSGSECLGCGVIC